MSEPVTNSQVEDVLSSIRRLVGDTKRKTAQSQPPSRPEKLVLTPQLRVADDGVLMLERENAVLAAEEWYEFEEPPMPEGENWRSGGSVRMNPSDHGAEVAQSGSTDAGSDASEKQAPQPDERLQYRAVERPAHAGSRVETLLDRRSSELSAKIAALETAIARTSDQWEPDDDETDDYAGTRSPSLIWQDNVDLDAKGSALTIRPLGASQNADGDDAQVIDEETLRDLVADIVREELSRNLVAEIVRAELQGDLGERITRNVRKLVRIEISRALAARDLD